MFVPERISAASSGTTNGPVEALNGPLGVPPELFVIPRNSGKSVIC